MNSYEFLHSDMIEQITAFLGDDSDEEDDTDDLDFDLSQYLTQTLPVDDASQWPAAPLAAPLPNLVSASA